MTQQDLPDRLTGTTATRLAGGQDLAALLPEPVGDILDLGRLADALDPFQRDEQSRRLHYSFSRSMSRPS